MPLKLRHSLIWAGLGLLSALLMGVLLSWVEVPDGRRAWGVLLTLALTLALGWERAGAKALRPPPAGAVPQFTQPVAHPTVVSIANPDRPQENQDRAMVDGLSRLAAVFDGSGGATLGQTAAHICYEILQQTLSEGLPEEQGWAERATGRVRQELLDARRTHPSLSGMSAAGAVVRISADQHLEMAWAGDVRVYRWRPGQPVEALTEDHNFLAWLSRLRMISRTRQARLQQALNESLSPQQAAQQAGRLARLLWRFRSALSNDLSRESGWVESQRVAWQPGDIAVVVTDGIHHNLTSQEITQALERGREKGGISGAARALATAALVRAQQPRHPRSQRDDMTCALLSG